MMRQTAVDLENLLQPEGKKKCVYVSRKIFRNILFINFNPYFMFFFRIYARIHEYRK